LLHAIRNSKNLYIKSIQNNNKYIFIIFGYKYINTNNIYLYYIQNINIRYICIYMDKYIFLKSYIVCNLYILSKYILYNILVICISKLY